MTESACVLKALSQDKERSKVNNSIHQQMVQEWRSRFIKQLHPLAHAQFASLNSLQRLSPKMGASDKNSHPKHPCTCNKLNKTLTALSKGQIQEGGGGGTFYVHEIFLTVIWWTMYSKMNVVFTKQSTHLFQTENVFQNQSGLTKDKRIQFENSARKILT